jgi:hypothetical protein
VVHERAFELLATYGTHFTRRLSSSGFQFPFTFATGCLRRFLLSLPLLSLLVGLLSTPRLRSLQNFPVRPAHFGTVTDKFEDWTRMESKVQSKWVTKTVSYA